MKATRRRDSRVLSRALLASATIVAALGVLSVRLTLGVLIGQQYAVAMGAGMIVWRSYEKGHPPPVAARWGPFILDRTDESVRWWFVTERPAVDDGAFGIPLWMPLAAMLIPGVWLAHKHRHRRGFCSHCGYDLAGLEAGKPCPECGRVPGRRSEPPSASA
jgi:hypothetical protein